MQLMLEPEDFPKKFYVILSTNADCSPSHELTFEDLEFYENFENAVMCSGHTKNIVAEYILNKTLQVEAAIEIIENKTKSEL